MNPNETPAPGGESTPPAQPTPTPAPATPPAAPTAPSAPSPAGGVGAYESNPFKLFGPSWHAIGRNLGTWALGYLAVIAVAIVLISIPAVMFATAHGKGAGVVVAVVAAVVALIAFLFVMARALGAGTFLMLAGVRGQKISLKEALAGGKPHGWRILIYNLLYGLMVAIGLVLLIIPGILLMTWYSMGPLAIVNENLSIGAALKRSKELTRGRFWDVFGVIAVPQIFNLLQFIPILGMIAGLILTIGYSAAPAFRYLMLKEAKDSNTTLPAVSKWNYVLPAVYVVFIGLSFGLAYNSAKSDLNSNGSFNYDYSTGSSGSDSGSSDSSY